MDNAILFYQVILNPLYNAVVIVGTDNLIGNGFNLGESIVNRHAVSGDRKSVV